VNEGGWGVSEGGWGVSEGGRGVGEGGWGVLSMIVITIWRRRDFLQVSTGKFRETPLNTVSVVMPLTPTA
jgi:hypothetical protein